MGNVAANAVRIQRPRSDKICSGGTKQGDPCDDGFDCFDGAAHACQDRWDDGSFGSSVHIGQVSCDGLVSLIIGDGGHDEFGPTGSRITNAGAVLVVAKATGLRFSLGTTIDIDNWGFLHVFAGTAGAGLGYASSGDVDGDGDSDLILGAPITGSLAGRAYVQGTASPTNADLCGNTGAFNNVTTPYIITPGGSCTPGVCDASHEIAVSGTGLAGIGLHAADVNDDGEVDLLVGAAGGVSAGPPGVVFIQHGPVAAGSLTYTVAGSHQDADVCIGCDESGDKAFGYSIDTQDCNGDGLPELLVGAPAYAASGRRTGAGALFSYLGGSYNVDRDTTFATAIVHGSSAGDNIGRAVAASAALIDGGAGADRQGIAVSGANVGADIGRALVLENPCNCIDVACDDSNACTTDTCGGPSVCQHVAAPNGTSCTDGNICNGAETCSGGVCQDGPNLNCNDGFSCTTDNCLFAPNDGGGCTHFPIHALCSPDGQFCNGEESCDPDEPGANPTTGCVVVNVPDCDDGIACTVDVCDEGGDACVHGGIDAACDDGLFCTGTETCDEATGCVSSGDPCTGGGACVVCDDGTDGCVDTDPDADEICAAEDNCDVEYNPDQLNSDCNDPTYLSSGCCDGSCNGGEVPAGKIGCCDGGDVCDDCAATTNHARCELALSGGLAIGPAGGSFTVGDCISIDVPPGALDVPTSISVSTGYDDPINPGTGRPFTPTRLKRGTMSVHKTVWLPDEHRFNLPVTVSFCWDDADDDGLVDLGVCESTTDCTEGGGDSCDQDSDCACGNCSEHRNAPVSEDVLFLQRDASRFDYRGFGPGRQRCGDVEHQEDDPGEMCTLAVADCGFDPGDGAASVAGCCDEDTNTWPFQTCNFSEMVVGELAGKLIPGKGPEATDCMSEWTIVNPFNDPYNDKRGFVNFKQTCTDGDPACDADGAVDGACTFEIGACLNVTDKRFSDETGALTCVATDVASWQLKKPSSVSKKPDEAAFAVALRDSMAAVAASSLGGKNDSTVVFDSAFADADACGEVVRYRVPLKGPASDRKAKATVVAIGTTSVVPPATRGTRDADRLKLTCLPSN